MRADPRAAFMEMAAIDLFCKESLIRSRGWPIHATARESAPKSRHREDGPAFTLIPGEDRD
jgi:hypothetical protein